MRTLILATPHAWAPPLAAYGLRKSPDTIVFPFGSLSEAVGKRLSGDGEKFRVIILAATNTDSDAARLTPIPDDYPAHLVESEAEDQRIAAHLATTLLQVVRENGHELIAVCAEDAACWGNALKETGYDAPLTYNVVLNDFGTSGFTRPTPLTTVVSYFGDPADEIERALLTAAAMEHGGFGLEGSRNLRARLAAKVGVRVLEEEDKRSEAAERCRAIVSEAIRCFAEGRPFSAEG